MASIYLAGKISRHDWRDDVVPNLQETWGGQWNSQSWSFRDSIWPIIPRGVLGVFDYTGPYFTETCGHSDEGCSQPEHRLGSWCEGDEVGRRGTRDLCFAAIEKADIVFAWLNDTTAYGTLVELGYAHARRKTVITAAPTLPCTPAELWDVDHGRLVGDGASGISDLWFAFTLGTCIEAATPREALEHIAGSTPRLDSPIEVAFWKAYLHIMPPALLGLKAQQPALGGKYRIDFALPDKKIGIELDGYAWHSSREAFTKDRERQRELELAGWRIIRFSGSEVKNDAARCVLQAATLVRGFEAAA